MNQNMHQQCITFDIDERRRKRRKKTNPKNRNNDALHKNIIVVYPNRNSITFRLSALNTPQT